MTIRDAITSQPRSWSNLIALPVAVATLPLIWWEQYCAALALTTLVLGIQVGQFAKRWFGGGHPRDE